MANEVLTAVGAVGTLFLGAGMARTGDFLRDRRAQREREMSDARQEQRAIETRRWEASVAVLTRRMPSTPRLGIWPLFAKNLGARRFASNRT
jgi:hypothetical protein